MKLRDVDVRNRATLVAWIRGDFLDVRTDARVWEAFRRNGAMSEATARDAVAGKRRSPRLVIVSLGRSDGRFRREFPHDIDVASEAADLFETAPDNPAARRLLESTLLAYTVAWRRNKTVGTDTDAAAGRFLDEAYDVRPSRAGLVFDDPNTLRITLTEQEVEDLVRITIAEAGGLGSSEGHDGRAGVIFTVLNRVASPEFPDTIRRVIDARNQFEPIRKVGSVAALPTPSRRDAEHIREIIEDIAGGLLHDVTNGATFFQNVAITRDRGTDFEGETGPVAVIANHSFYDRFKNNPRVEVPPWRITTPFGPARHA